MALVIEKEKLLIVEGNDDRTAIYKLIKALKINDIQVACMEGKNQKNKFVNTLAAALKTSRLNDTNIKAFGIILDADDNDANSSFQKVKSILNEIKKRNIQNLNFDIPQKCFEFTNSPTKVGVFIMPDCNSAGMLETLCLKSVENEDFYHCVDNFIKEAKSIKEDLDHIDKRKALAFIALKTKKGKRKTVGEAVEDGIFNIEDPAFDKIKSFLKEMASL